MVMAMTEMDIVQQVTVVLVTYNSRRVLSEALTPLREGPPVIVVDNGSSDGTPELARSLLPQAKVIELGRNIGFGGANNAALEIVQTPFAFLLNPDCVVPPAAIAALVSAAQRYPDAAILAPRLYDEPGRLGLCYRSSFYHKQPRELRDPDGDLCSEFLTGAAMLLRMEVFRRIGFFDPWFFLYLEDDDLCLRVRAAGHSLVLVHDACGEHRVKQSSPASLRLDFRRGYCATASKLYALNKHLGRSTYRRAYYRSLFGAAFALLAAGVTFNRRRTMRSIGRLLAAWRAPRLLRRQHCIDALD